MPKRNGKKSKGRDLWDKFLHKIEKAREYNPYRRFSKLWGGMFIFMALFFIACSFYPFIDGVGVFKHCWGFWVFSVAGLIFFVIEPTIFYAVTAVYFCLKKTSITSHAKKKEIRVRNKLTKKDYKTIAWRVLWCIAFIYHIFMSLCIVWLVITTAVDHFPSLPKSSGNIDVSNFLRDSTDITIKRDVDLIPHISGTSLSNLYFGQGYMHAHDRLAQIDRYRRICSGRLGEVSSENGVRESDIFFKVLGLHRQSQRLMQSKTISNETKSYLNKYAAGVNAYASQKDRNFEMNKLGYEWTNNWTPEDSLCILKMFQFIHSGNHDKELSRFRLLIEKDLSVDDTLFYDPPHVEDETNVFEPTELDMFPIQIEENKLAEQQLFVNEKVYLDQLKQTIKNKYYNGNDIPQKNYDSTEDFVDNMIYPGSKFFGSALDAHTSHSTSFMVHQNATSSTKPIIGTSTSFQSTSSSLYYLCHLVHMLEKNPDEPTDENLSRELVGTSIVGVPGMLMGKTFFFTFSAAPMLADQSDVLILDATATEYRDIDGTMVPFTERIEEVEFKNKKTQIKVRETKYGPVMTDQVWNKGSFSNVPMVLRWVGNEEDTTIEWITTAWNATSRTDFREITTKKLMAPSMNILYADRDDYSMVVLAGKVPNRKSHTGLFPTELSPTTNWNEYFVPRFQTRFENKRVIIAGGQKTVGRGYTANLGFDFAMDTKAEHIKTILNSLIFSGQKVTSNTVEQIMNSRTSSMFVYHIKPMLQELSNNNTLTNERAKNALKFLLEWDGEASSGSKRATVFYHFIDDLMRIIASGKTGIKWWNRPLLVLNYIKSSRFDFRSIEAALLNSYASSDEEWGKIRKFKLQSLAIPSSNSYDCACSRGLRRGGSFDTVDTSPSSHYERKFKAQGGAAYKQMSSIDNNVFKYIVPLSNSQIVWQKEKFENFLKKYDNNDLLEMKMGDARFISTLVLSATSNAS